MNKSENIFVSVICNTYNHEPYIRQCLEGFVMQKTTFAFEVLIHDDASTDETADIIREYEAKYPDLIKPIYQIENQYSKKTGIMKTFQYPRVKGKYIALCEGDDYWIDPFKLQKQVVFLESNIEYGMVRTEINRYIQNGNRIEEKYFTRIRERNNSDTLEDYILYGWYAAPCTWLYRSSLINNIPVLNPQKCFTGDILLILHIASNSKIYFCPDVTAVYRVLENSASHFESLKEYRTFMLKVWNTRVYYACKQSLKLRCLFWWKTCIIQLRPSFKKEIQLLPWWVFHCIKSLLILLIPKINESSLDN